MSLVSDSYDKESSTLITPRRGKAPPVPCFLGTVWKTHEMIGYLLKGAAEWNGWSDPECLLQLSGYLRGKAWQEFLLLEESNKFNFTQAIAAVGKKLNSGNRTLAAQDFRHATQALNESVSDYILHLEKIFRQAYGRKHSYRDTEHALIFPVTGEASICPYESTISIWCSGLPTTVHCCMQWRAPFDRSCQMAAIHHQRLCVRFNGSPSLEAFICTWETSEGLG